MQPADARQPAAFVAAGAGTPRAERFLAMARAFLNENAVAVGCCTVLDDER